jgi:hypothetical protein
MLPEQSPRRDLYRGVIYLGATDQPVCLGEKSYYEEPDPKADGLQISNPELMARSVCFRGFHCSFALFVVLLFAISSMEL